MHKKIIALVSAVGLLSSNSVLALAPGDLTGDGYYQMWWVSPIQSNHLPAIDESVCNGDTDYIYTSTSGVKESFNVWVSTSTPQHVSKIKISPCAKRLSRVPGSLTMMYFYRLNGVDSALYYGPTISSSSYTTYGPTEISTDFDYDPGTDDLEVGMVYYSGTGELKVSKLGVVVEY